MNSPSLLKDENEQSSVRAIASRIFDELDSQLTQDIEKRLQESVQNNVAPSHNSWIRGACTRDSEYKPSRQCAYFDLHGFLLVPSFAHASQVSAMKQQMETLVDEEWDPSGEKGPTVFRTDDKQIDEQGSDDYFLESSNKVHFFAEPRAMTKEGRFNQDFLDDKILALNKAGHGMHVCPGAFHDYTTSSNVRELVKELGWVDPVVPQSMYIFKQAIIGGEVTSHQDSTFLYTTPKQSCLGLWLALDDATITNGCLWVRPGSHLEPTRIKFVKNAQHFGEEAIQTRSNIAKGDLTKSQMVFIDEPPGPNSKTIDWVGKIPDIDGCETPWDSLFAAGFVPVECKAGDLVIFPGELDHLSLPNTSEHQRHTFQLHMVEGEGAGVEWAATNWLQYPKGTPFLRINE